MSDALAPPPDDSPAKAPEPPWREFARAPLVPVALAATLGLAADRYVDVSGFAALAVGLGGLLAWVAGRDRPSAPLWLAVAAAGLAAAYHHAHRHSFEPDDIGTFATDTPTPVKVRGRLAEEPVRYRPPRPDPLVTEHATGITMVTLNVAAIETRDGWSSASGRVRLSVEGRLDELHGGDSVEVGGRLSRPPTPSNPGERDTRSLLLDQRITALLRVEKSAAGVVRREEGWRGSLPGWLGVVRGWGTRSLQESLPPDESGLAAALLLGDRVALDREEWDRYLRTGVVHVLAISGQHLVVFGAFVWFALKVCGARRRHGAWVVAGVLVGYALLTGAQPSAVRAAVMVCAFCAAIVARRPLMLANAFALAWIVVVTANPTDPFTAGCQLSFVAVFVLVWMVPRLLAPRPLTPAEQLLEETRSVPEQVVRAAARSVWAVFAAGFLLTTVNAPLVLAWQNIVSPVAFALGPPLTLLTAIALVTGFLLLLVSPLGAWAAWPFARLTEWSLAGCDVLVSLAEQIPGAWVYAPAPRMWWLVGFYLGVATLVLFPGAWSRRILVALAAWVFAGLALVPDPRAADECRFTFLAVGHGGCVVIETPDGRVILYDAGTTTGPDAVRRVIAPFLWSRGVSRIDEVFVSHADLDHFNGLPELLKRFAVGRVTLTPSFSDKSTPGVEAALAAFERQKVAVRVAVAGERFDAGSVAFDVLHPPAEGPPGNENTRSMVLLVRFGTARVLLTGDLESEGQTMVLERRIPPVDVMLAPHHGAKGANAARRGPKDEPLPAPMAAWAKPKLVISSQRPGSTEHLAAAYAGATVWDTPTAGAVTVRCHSTGVTAETFRTGAVRVVKSGE